MKPSSARLGQMLGTYTAGIIVGIGAAREIPWLAGLGLAIFLLLYEWRYWYDHAKERQ
jgi:hypothetical protein